MGVEGPHAPPANGPFDLIPPMGNNNRTHCNHVEPSNTLAPGPPTSLPGRSSHDAGGPVDEHGVPTQYVRDPRSGRLTAVGAVGGGPQSDSEKRKLYGDYGGWVNPDEVRDGHDGRFCLQKST